MRKIICILSLCIIFMCGCNKKNSISTPQKDAAEIREYFQQSLKGEISSEEVRRIIQVKTDLYLENRGRDETEQFLRLATDAIAGD